MLEGTSSFLFPALKGENAPTLALCLSSFNQILAGSSWACWRGASVHSSVKPNLYVHPSGSAGCYHNTVVPESNTGYTEWASHRWFLIQKPVSSGVGCDFRDLLTPKLLELFISIIPSSSGQHYIPYWYCPQQKGFESQKVIGSREDQQGHANNCHKIHIYKIKSNFFGKLHSPNNSKH